MKFIHPQACQPASSPPIEPEWAREAYIKQRFGLGRTTLYNLRKKGKIRSSCTLIEGEKRSVRLFHVGSVRAFIEGCEVGKDLQVTASLRCPNH